MIRNKRSFTLIEVVLTMAILGICLTPLCIMIVNVVQKNVLSQVQATAVSLAQGEMEKVTNLRFSNVNCEASSAFSNPFSAYSKQVFVDYVFAGALDASVGQPSLCASPGGTATDYKKVRVVISHPIIGSLTLATLVTRDW